MPNKSPWLGIHGYWMIWYPWQNGNIRGFFHYNPIIIPLTHHDKTETSGPCLDDLRKAQRLPRASTNCCAPKLGRLGPDQETQVQWQTKLTPWVSISRQRFNSWGIHGYSVWLYNCYCILCVIIDCFLNGFSPAAPGIPKLSDFSEPATRQGTGAMEDVLALWKFHYLGR